MIHHRFYGTKYFLEPFYSYKDKKNYIFEKINNCNNLDIYAMVMYCVL